MIARKSKVQDGAQKLIDVCLEICAIDALRDAVLIV